MAFSEYMDDAAKAVGKVFNTGKRVAATTSMDDIAKGTKKLFKEASTGAAATKVKSGVKEAASHKLFNNRRNKLIAQDIAEKASPTIKSVLRPTRLVDPGLGNLFTGHELKRGVDVALGAGALAFGVGLGTIQANKDSQQSVRQEHVGNLQGLSYDAVANGSGGRKDLGATGELVFGLHNQRRG